MLKPISETMSSTECLAKRDEWLDKAIKAEGEGKSESFIDKILAKAAQYEQAGYARA